MKRLKNLDVDEVSLVDIGANKKKFLIFKSKSGGNNVKISKSIQSVIKSLRIKKEAELEKEPTKKAEGDMLPGKDSAVYKDLSEGAQAALKAIARILTPFKEEITDENIDEVLHEIGISFPHAEGTEKEAEGEEGGKEEMHKLFAIPEEVKEEHAAEALNKAKEAMNEHLEKLGYRQHEDEEPAMKEAEMGVHKAKFEQVFKAHKELVQKNAELEKTIKTMQEKEVEKEIVQKAKSFTHLGLKHDDVVEVLRAAKSTSDKNYETVCKQYGALNEQAKKANVFGEIGSSMQNGGASDVESKIDAAVNEIVKKSNISKEKAYSEFIQTAEGRQLYGEMKSSRPHQA